MGIPRIKISEAGVRIRLISRVLIYLVGLTGWHGVAADDPSPSTPDKIWNAAKLYQNEQNRHIQDFSLIGRYHGQYWYASSQGNRDQDWENRRIFAGFKAKLYRRFTLESQIAIDDEFDPAYDGLYVTFLKWDNASDSYSVSGGRLDYLFSGLERSESSKRIKTIERSLLVNQIMPGEVVGLHSSGKGGSFNWQAGVFSGSIEDEFTSFDGGVAAVVGVDRDLPLSYQSGSIHLDYLYNDGDELNNAFEPYEHILSLWHEGSAGRFSLGIDLTAALGVGEQSDVFGLTLLPAWEIGNDVLLGGDRLQLAGRYHHASSRDPHGLSFARRYEQNVASGQGDSYQSLYLGLNYLLYEHRLKFMAGAEYFDMGGVIDESGRSVGSTDGWSFAIGIRLYF